jgi:hypothetical protein
MTDDTLMTVQDVITDVRTIILDQVQPYRYTDDELLVALNSMLLEASRMRPDIFLHHHERHVPHFDSVSGQKVGVESQFRLAFVYGTASHALLRDEEDVQDARVNMFQAKFEWILTGRTTMPAAAGGTPAAKSPQG